MIAVLARVAITAQLSAVKASKIDGESPRSEKSVKWPKASRVFIIGRRIRTDALPGSKDDPRD
ncbi:MAG: hypothetical protein ACREFB_16035 [Stellaceae bacterium]